jgi:hypothetical protein
VPSLAHHALVDLLRRQPSLAPGLLARTLGLPIPRGTRCQLADSNLDHLRPAERRADLVLELRRRRRVLLVLVLEVQRRIDERKRLAWFDYLVSARRRGPACVVVITTSARVATWAAQPFNLGPGNHALRVWVLGPEQIVPITDADTAREAPILAFLSAIVHAQREPATLAAAAACLSVLADEQIELYYTALSQSLTPRLRADLELRMLNLSDSQKKNPLVQRMLQVFALQAEARRAEAETLREERRMAIVTRREVLLQLLKVRGFKVTATQSRLVEDCTNKRTLDRWLRRLITATSARAVFAPPKSRTAQTS